METHMAFAADAENLQVVINIAGQYSLWPLSRPLPAGWRGGGFCGTRAACLDYIERVWTDMRPAALRQTMASGRGEA